MNEYFDKIFVINLNHRSDRWEQCTKLFSEYNITNYERFEAICPKYENIPKKLYNNLVVNKKEWYVTGAVGCKLSHLEIIKLAKERNYNNFLVLEDDFCIQKTIGDFNNIFNNFINEIKNINWDMIYLGGNNLIKPKSINNLKLLHKAVKVNTTHAYCLNKSLFDKCINEISICGTEIDDYYKNNIQKNNELNVYCIFPSLIKQRESVSDIFKGSVMKYNFD